MNFIDAEKDFLNYCIFEKGLSNKTKISYANDLKIYRNYLRTIYSTNPNVKEIKEAKNNLWKCAKRLR